MSIDRNAFPRKTTPQCTIGTSHFVCSKRRTIILFANSKYSLPLKYSLPPYFRNQLKWRHTLAGFAKLKAFRVCYFNENGNKYTSCIPIKQTSETKPILCIMCLCVNIFVIFFDLPS